MRDSFFLFYSSFAFGELNLLSQSSVLLLAQKETKQRKKLRKCQLQSFSSARYTGHCYAAPRKTTAVRTIFGFATAPVLI
jgi:hypothetical protein